MTRNPKLAAECRRLAERLPASATGRTMRGRGARWTPRLTQKEVDILWAALTHHEFYCERGRHEDSDEQPAIVKRMAAKLSAGGPRVHEQFDPYQGYSPAQRAFAQDMDIWTLEQVIVRVMTEIDRRRRKVFGKEPMKAMATQRGVAG